MLCDDWKNSISQQIYNEGQNDIKIPKCSILKEQEYLEDINNNNYANLENNGIILYSSNSHTR